MGNMRFKVGDRVKIKSLDWYNKNKDKDGNIVFSSKVPHFSWNVNVRTMFTKDMVKFCGKVVTIESVWTANYSIVEDTRRDYFTDEMIEGLAESDDFEKMCMESEKRYEEEYSTGKYCHEQSFKWGFQEGYNYSHENDKLEISLKDGYQFVDENGNVINATKIVLEKKKKEYPKTYEECCKILGFLNVDLCFNADYRSFDASKEQWKRLGLMNQFYQLLICRDAYWKIAGEEMGLGKPWELNWGKGACYTICCNTNQIVIGTDKFRNSILTFPTEEMRDAFYENFKELIEQCKELL